MTDPRELGLPPVGPAPYFAPTRSAIESSRRRHQHRRRNRTVYTGAAAAALAAAVFASQLGEGSTSVLEQNQPAVAPGPAVTVAPSGAVEDVTASPAPAATASATRVMTGRRAAVDENPAAGPALPRYDSTRWVRRDVRDEYAPAYECSSAPVSEWTPTGWCIAATLPATIRTGHRTRLDVRVCRTGVERGVLTFPSSRQAAVEMWNPKTKRLVWSSASRPSPFRAGERVMLQPQHCLQWTTVWDVTVGGRPITPGTYQYRWTTGTGLSAPTGAGDLQVQGVKVLAR
jgi:hypothetical protein